MLSWGVSMVVRFYWLAACDCHQCCVGIFHDALRVELRERALRQLAGLHGCLLFSEPSRHSATKGKTETASAINPQTFFFLFFLQYRFEEKFTFPVSQTAYLFIYLLIPMPFATGGGSRNLLCSRDQESRWGRLSKCGVCTEWQQSR